MNTEQRSVLEKVSRIIDDRRAGDIRRLLNWKHGGCLCMGATQPDVETLSPEEEAAIRALWDTLPGSSCLADVLQLLAAPGKNGRPGRNGKSCGYNLVAATGRAGFNRWLD